MRTILAVLLSLLGSLIAPACAQAPPAIPALPDTERRTAYAITNQTGPFNVNFQIYGDGTDYGAWIEVWLDGVMLAPGSQWTLSLATGTLATAARPLQNARVTLTTASTGTLQIVGARRPRRTSQFIENQGVSARSLNQALTDVVAQNRETWDKINDVSGRTLLAPPGETMRVLPPALSRVGHLLGFDTGGQPVMTDGTFVITPIGTGMTAYPTRAAAQAATIATAIAVLQINGYSTVGDAPPANYIRIPCAATVAWGFQSADKIDSTGATCTGTNINWRLNVDELDVRHVGVVCNASGTVNNTTTLKAVAGYILATNARVVNFPPGPVNCGIWPSGTAVPTENLFDLQSATITGLTVNYNGACISTSSVDADWGGTTISYLWRFADASRITFNNPCYLQAGTTNPTSLYGGVQIQNTGQGDGFTINNGKQIGGYSGYIVSRNAGTIDNFNNVKVNGFESNGTYYPIVLQKNGNNAHIVNIYSENHGRFFFAQNVKNVFFRGRMKVSGHVGPEGALLKVYCDNADSINVNTLEAIDFGLEIVDSAAVLPDSYVLVEMSYQQVAGDTCNNKGVMRNIKINLTGRLPPTTNLSVGVTNSRILANGNFDTTVRGYVWDNIEIGGSLYNTHPTPLGLVLINLFQTPKGTFTGDAIGNITIDKLLLRTAAGTPGANNIQIDGAVISGLRLDSVIVPNNIALTNIALASFTSRLVTSAAFTVNGLAYTSGFGSGSTSSISTTVAGLPTCNVSGMRSFVTDSNAASYTAGIGAIVAAGGATKVPVVCDGTNWRIG